MATRDQRAGTPMRVILSALADYASISTESKLNILGMFNQVTWSGPDTAVPMLYTVFVLEPDDDDHEKTRIFQISLENPEGSEVIRTPATEVTVPPRPAQGRLRMNQVAGFGGVLFPEAGMYHFTLHMDDAPLCSLDLPVVQFQEG